MFMLFVVELFYWEWSFFSFIRPLQSDSRKKNIFVFLFCFICKYISRIFRHFIDAIVIVYKYMSVCVCVCVWVESVCLYYIQFMALKLLGFLLLFACDSNWCVMYCVCVWVSVWMINLFKSHDPHPVNQIVESYVRAYCIFIRDFFLHWF